MEIGLTQTYSTRFAELLLYLYTALVRVYEEDKELLQTAVRLGLKIFEYTANVRSWVAR